MLARRPFRCLHAGRRPSTVSTTRAPLSFAPPTPLLPNPALKIICFPVSVHALPLSPDNHPLLFLFRPKSHRQSPPPHQTFLARVHACFLHYISSWWQYICFSKVTVSVPIQKATAPTHPHCTLPTLCFYHNHTTLTIICYSKIPVSLSKCKMQSCLTPHKGFLSQMLSRPLWLSPLLSWKWVHQNCPFYGCKQNWLHWGRGHWLGWVRQE